MEINTGNTAWLLLSSALVLLMTPGLALFYGGLNRSKGVLNMMMMSFSCIGLVSVLWVLYGFTLAFGVNDNAGLNNIIGNFSQYFGTGTSAITEEWLFFGANTGIPTPHTLAQWREWDRTWSEVEDPIARQFVPRMHEAQRSLFGR